MKFALLKNESPAKGISRLSKILARAPRRRISRSGSMGDDEIHLIRICIKRMRTLLRTVRSTTDESICREEDIRLQRVAQRLSPYRDRHMQLQTLALLAKRVDEKNFRELIETVRKSWMTATKFPRLEIRRAVRLALDALDECTVELSRISWRKSGWKALEPGIKKSYRNARKCYREIEQERGIDAFHRLRMETKRLQYQIEMLSPMAPKVLNPMLEKLRQLVQMLGLEHDLVVTAHFLVHKGYQSREVISIGELLDHMEDWSAQLRESSQELATALFAQKYSKWSAGFPRLWKRWKNGG